MRITERKLRRIIREAISEDLNEGIFGDFVDNFSKSTDYKKYKMMLQLCEKLFENLKEDERFHDIYLYLDDKSMKNVISGDLKIRASTERYSSQVRTNPNNNNKIRNMSYSYNVTSEISEDISNLILKFNNKYGGYKNFVVNVQLESGKNRFLNRPNFELEEVKNIGDRIHKEFLNVMDERESERKRNRQENEDREARKAKRAKELGQDR